MRLITSWRFLLLGAGLAMASPALAGSQSHYPEYWRERDDDD